MHEARAGLALVCLVVVSAGCSPTRHRLAPYRDDAATALELEREAMATCERRRDGQRPPNAFKTDGCSTWFDDGWATCCLAHDQAYWCGGRYADRRDADRELRRCVAASGHPIIGALMYPGVRIGGSRLWPFPFRWAYGWPYWGRAEAADTE